MCIRCDDAVVNDTRHTLFECSACEHQRQAILGVLPRRIVTLGNICKGNLVPLMLQDYESGAAV